MNDKLLPIVPGCEAIIIVSGKNPENVGKQVKVEKFCLYGHIYEGTKYTGDGGWLVTGDITNYTRRNGFAYYKEKSLMRIDGKDFSKETETDKERERVI